MTITDPKSKSRKAPPQALAAPQAPLVGQIVLYSHFASLACGSAHESILSPAIITRLHPRSTLVDLWVFGPNAIFKANAAPQGQAHGGWRPCGPPPVEALRASTASQPSAGGL